MSALYESILEGTEQLIEADLEQLERIRKEKALFTAIFERKIDDSENVDIDSQILNQLALEEKGITDGLNKLLKRLQSIEHCITNTGILGRVKEQGKFAGASDFEPSIFERNDVGNTKEKANGNRGKTK